MQYKHVENKISISKLRVKIQINDKKLNLVANQSCFVPIGAKHRLSNPGQSPLIIIEVQSGSYLGEDDIIRFEDIYGRTVF